MTPRCRRCSGSLVISIDPEDGSRIGECASCGQLAAWEELNRPEPGEIDGRRREPKEDAVTQMDWRVAAKGELDALIEAIVKVEDQKEEAERIRAALQHLGVPDLPELPWKGRGKSHARGIMKPWTDEDDAYLLQRFNAGHKVTDIAVGLGRHPTGVYARLDRLGLRLKNHEAVPA